MTDNSNHTLHPEIIKALSHSLFHQVDNLFSRGWNFGPEDVLEHSYINDYEAGLRLWYRQKNLELCRQPEGVYFMEQKSRAQGQLIRRTKMKKFSAFVGQVLCLMHNEGASIHSGWIPEADVMERIREKVSDERLANLLGRRVGNMRGDWNEKRIQEAFHDALNQLKGINMIARSPKKGSDAAIRVKTGINRFLDPLRDLQDASEAGYLAHLDTLIRNGYIDDLAERASDADGLEPDDALPTEDSETLEG
ncbi:chromosome partition protein MukE [Vibrio parahaemolyticus]|uniref:chromosome partition protein MukE n=1 Tax=Vibrio parahaemolyticus TaxID=670 RepID=UPI00111D7F38|nr:chromosome partition protein MukE [Vibrio parahaemolyticus]EGQ7818126.1 hypothetical protein [Vibrio parahaemolyticus]MBE3843633.1 hypothetical protein [Vibrio parahaemolyticus]MBE3943712.1 hypothetical protein [Vibrio parahaemolyticus]MBE4119359.1 hypothetical protein [Vibrio parahaemolyticus]MBE4127958.1 hypothetical protein [Vibrio parahaemolyticus]